MSTGPSDPLRSRSFLSPSIYRVILIWGIVVVGIYLVVRTTSQQATNQKEPDRNAVAVPSSPSEPKPNAREPSTSVQNSKEDDRRNIPTPVEPPRPSPETIAAAKMRWVAVKAQIEDIRESLEPANADTSTWLMLVKELPTNETGKKIAGSKAHVDQYSTLMAQPRSSARSAGQIRDTLQVHMETVQHYLGQTDNITAPKTELLTELDQLQEKVKTLAREYHRDRLALESLISETATLPPSEQSLEKVAEQREKEVAGEYLAQLTAAKAKAEAESQSRLREAEEKVIKDKAQAEAESRKKLGDEEVKQIRAETERRVREQQEVRDKAERDAEAKRLRAMAEDPVIQKKYSALLEKGYMTFRNSPGGMQDKGNRPAPASFGDLTKRGWLKDAESFAKAMSKQPNTDFNIFNDRPTHAYPKSAAEWDEMEKLLTQFRLLGPIWVEMKLLDP